MYATLIPWSRTGGGSSKLRRSNSRFLFSTWHFEHIHTGKVSFPKVVVITADTHIKP